MSERLWPLVAAAHVVFVWRWRRRSSCGMVPPLHELAAGCHFAARCPHAMPRCRQDTPLVISDAQGHATACWLLVEAQADA